MRMCWGKLHMLGKGSYGTVSLAAPLISSTPKFAAVKSADFKHSSSLRVEGEILNKFKGSPYIVQCFGEDESVENGIQTYNLLLEYAAGGTLHDLIIWKRGMSELEVSYHASQLLMGISRIHSEGFVHCDLKPDNILVFPNNVLKLADFGLALEAAADGNDEPLHQTYWNGYSECLNRGTPLYASPEAVACGIHGKAVDIWALGCIVAEMFTGRPLWSTSNIGDLELKIMYEEPEIPSDVSKEAMDFMAKCLERDHGWRWSADMLLNHPFIQSNQSRLMNEDGLMSSNPFGRGRSSWVSEKNLFSTLPSSFNSGYFMGGCTTAQQVPVMSERDFINNLQFA